MGFLCATGISDSAAAIVFMGPVFVIFLQDLRWYHMAAAALYLVNFDFGHPWFLGHLWSLSVEEQFYFCTRGAEEMASASRADSGREVAFARYRVACHLSGAAWASGRNVSGGGGYFGDRVPAGSFRGARAEDKNFVGVGDDRAGGAGYGV